MLRLLSPSRASRARKSKHPPAVRHPSHVAVVLTKTLTLNSSTDALRIHGREGHSRAPEDPLRVLSGEEVAAAQGAAAQARWRLARGTAILHPPLSSRRCLPAVLTSLGDLGLCAHRRGGNGPAHADCRGITPEAAACCGEGEGELAQFFSYLLEIG